MTRDIRRVDVMIAVGAFVLLGIVSILTGSGALEPFFVLALTAPLLFRRSQPTLSAASIYAASLLQVLLGVEAMPANFTVLIALYSVTVHGPRWASIAAVLGGVVGAGIFATVLDAHWGTIFVTTVLAVVIAWTFGMTRRARREELEALRGRAEAVERQQITDAELAVAAERARIAREMHDIVAHSLAVIIAQADGGRYAAKADPEQGVRSLETIADIGRSALGDIRRILGVLRSDDADGALVRPQPTADDLAEIVARVRETGATVAWTTIGQPKPLLPGMGLVLQRVCQEALTNAMKHAGEGASMAVALQWLDDEVILQVDDDGRGAAAISDGAGSGLIGMRERAQLFGGTLAAGPRLTGGYRVHLSLPLPETHQEHE